MIVKVLIYAVLLIGVIFWLFNWFVPTVLALDNKEVYPGWLWDSIFNRKKKKLKTSVDKVAEANQLISQAEELYKDADENVQKEIASILSELRERKEASAEVKKRLKKLAQ